MTGRDHAPRRADAVPSVAAVTVRHWCDRLREDGVDVASVLGWAGLDEALLQSPTARITVDQLRWMAAAAQRAAPRPTLALEAGATLPLSAHGPLDALVDSAPDLRRLVVALQQQLPPRLLCTMTLEPAPGGLWCVLDAGVAPPELRRFLLDQLVACLASVVHRRAGAFLRELRLELPWPAPPWRKAYESLSADLRFSAPRLAAWLPDGVLDRPCAGGSAARHEAAWRDCQAHDVPPPAADGLAARVLALLDRLDHPIDAAAVADHLGLTARTMARRLAREGASFRSLLDGWRRQRARLLLAHSALSVAEVARHLGYRDPSNFSRCARRWLGQPPGRARQVT